MMTNYARRKRKEKKGKERGGKRGLALKLYLLSFPYLLTPKAPAGPALRKKGGKSEPFFLPNTVPLPKRARIVGKEEKKIPSYLPWSPKCFPVSMGLRRKEGRKGTRKGGVLFIYLILFSSSTTNRLEKGSVPARRNGR